MMLIENKFNIGEKVYLSTDPDQLARLVTEIKINPAGLVYVLSCGQTTSEHYELEISKTINVLMKSTN